MRVLVRPGGLATPTFLGFSTNDFGSANTTGLFRLAQFQSEVFVLAPNQQLYLGSSTFNVNNLVSFSESDAVKLDDVSPPVTGAEGPASQLRAVRQTLTTAVTLVAAPPSGPLRVRVRNLGVNSIALSHDPNNINDPQQVEFTYRLFPGESDVFVLAPNQTLSAGGFDGATVAAIFTTLYTDVFSPVEISSMKDRMAATAAWRAMWQ